MKILLAVDGSKYSLDAVDCLIEHADWYREKPEVELVTVHLPVPQLPRMGMVVSKQQIERYYEEEGRASLAQAQAKLGAAGIKYNSRVLVGPIAESLVAHAKKYACDLIYIGTHGRTVTGKLLLGSVATKVMHISTVPVLLVR
ncbi:MAG: universal stress protein [Betaproteobacteria bacterium]|nr:universal stress protein [Betaproteobacteria bacterium]